MIKLQSMFLPRHQKFLFRHLLILLFCYSFSTFSEAANNTEHAGNALEVLLPLSAFSISLIQQDYDGAMQLGKSLAATIITTQALKYSVDAKRPNGKEHSFPSGHSALAFSSAEYIRARYDIAYGIPAYTLATFVAYSRVESEQHYTRDVLAGAAIGIISSYYFTTEYKAVKIQPELSVNYVGITMTGTW